MRIVAGRLRGRTLPCPDVPGLRPTAERVREALFSILGDVEDQVVLDLFAGTGALGLEALSRGARSVIFVERDPLLAKGIERSIATLDLARRAEVVRGALPATLQALERKGLIFDLVLADPPYTGPIGRETLAHPALLTCLTRDGLAVFEHREDGRAESPGALPCPPGLTRVDERRYGSTALSFYRHAEVAGGDTSSQGDSP